MYGDTILPHMLRPIKNVLEDPAVTEIVIQRPCEVGIERAGQWEWIDVPEFDARTLDAIGIVSGFMLSKPFDPEHPICMTTLPGGQRATFVRDPIVKTPSITIRIPSKTKSSVHDQRFQRAFREPMLGVQEDAELLRLYEAADYGPFFSLAVRRKKNIAAIGETGAGKTFFLRTVMSEIPPEDRLVTIEDTSEFGPLHIRNRVEMIFGSAGITASDLVECSLRQRPDRVAVQELRGREIWAYMRILAAGYRGSFTTWHASREAPFDPLILMAKQTVEGQSMDANDMEQDFRRNIDVVVHCHKNASTNTYSNEIVWFKGVHDA